MYHNNSRCSIQSLKMEDINSISEINGNNPGFFHLALNASQSPPPLKFRNRLEVVKKLKNDFQECPGNFTNCAVLNLLGTLYFYNGEAGEAISHFKKVIRDFDKYNRNSLANLMFVYQRIHMTKKSEEFKRQLEISEEDEELYTAKYIAEQAFAMLFDVHLERPVAIRNDPPFKLLKYSLEKLGKCTKHNAFLMDEIRYWFSEVCYKLFIASFRSKCHKEKEEYYRLGVENIYAVLESGKITSSAAFREGAWTYFGMFMHKTPFTSWDEKGKRLSLDRNKDVPEVVREKNLDKFYEEPYLSFRCFKSESMKDHEKYHVPDVESLLDFQGTEICIRLATILNEEGKCDQALKYLRKAWEIDSTEGNWFALTTKAKCHLSKVRNRIKEIDQHHEADTPNTEDQNDKGPVTEEPGRVADHVETQVASAQSLQHMERDHWSLQKADFDHLDQAEKDYKKAIGMNPTPVDLADLANVYELRAKHTPGLDDDEKEELETHASDYYNQAIEHIGKEKRPEIHRRYGRFLRHIGEDRQAIECFKRAMEVDTMNKESLSFQQLFETLLLMYKKEGGTDLPSESEKKKENKSQDRSASSKDEEQDERSKELEDIDHEESPVTDSSSLGQDLEEDTHPSSEVSVSEGHSNVLTEDEIKYLQILAAASGSRKTMLHEITYWLDLALKKYKKMDKILSPFIEESPIEFGMIASFCKVAKGDHEINNKPVGDHVFSLLPSESEEYLKFKCAYELGLSELRQQTKVENTPHCPTCQNLLRRQDSMLPAIKMSARNLRYKFDFFIIFAPEEKEWVFYSLLKRLEGSYGYKGAFDERDFRPGRISLDEPHYFLENSFKVLVVLSKGFDAKTKYHLDLAQYMQMQKRREHFIIPILRSTSGDLPQLNPLICLNAVDDINWEKLIQALEMR